MHDKINIPEHLLQTFIHQKRLSGKVAFLRFIKQNKNLDAFYDFCEEHNHLLPEQTAKSILFHGSQKPQASLIPNASVGQGGKTERGAYVYATDDPNYAIFLAILDLKNGSASVNATNKSTTLIIDLDVVNGPSRLKDGYVHVITNTIFKKTTNREYKTNKSVHVLFAVPVTPQDLTVPICVQTLT